MPSPIYLRLLGYAVTLVIHSFTFHDVVSRLTVTTKDPIVADFATLQDKFITIWTFLFQIVYAILGIWCDLLNLGFGSERIVPKLMNQFRETLFSAIVWPTSLLIPATFWPLYFYDSHLVFPSFIDQILSFSNNQVMHSYVAVVVFWELIFLKRSQPNHKLNVSILMGYTILYLYTLFSSYFERGSFIYPILNQTYGSIYFPVFFVIVAIVLFSSYCIQWPLTAIVWGASKDNVAKNVH